MKLNWSCHGLLIGACVRTGVAAIPAMTPDIARVPIAKETAGRQVAVIEPFAAKVSDGHSAAEMEERRVRTDGDTAGVQVANFRRDFGWQAGCHMQLNDFSDRLRDLRSLISQ